jgi:hypothetical protein
VTDKSLKHTLLENISLPPDLKEFAAVLPPGSEVAGDKTTALLEAARKIARPWGAHAPLTPKVLSRDRVSLAGHVFTGELLVKNIGKLSEVRAFLASEGPELELWSESLEGEDRKIAFAIRFASLKTAEDAVENEIKGIIGSDAVSAMAPGALEEWPLSEQKVMMALMGEIAEKKGLRLRKDTARFWLEPAISSTGIFFHSPEGFSSCALCKAECPMRRFPENKARSD